jgi:hypothetical protein
MDKAFEAAMKEWDRREAEKFLDAHCMICGGRSNGRNPLHLTNDWKQFVCDEHRDLDTSKRVVDMSAHIQMDDSCARIDGHRLTAREEWIATYKRWLADSRWTLINVPEWLVQALHAQEAHPGQLSLFEESEAQND